MVKILVILLCFIMNMYVCAENVNVIINENFNDTDNWEILKFNKIKKYTQYYIIKNKNSSYLKTESNSSASALIYSKSFNVYKFPIVEWEWKISNVYKKGNLKEKKGDDYPIRIYIMFEYNPEKASFWEKIKYGAVKKIYGKYPPHSSLNYIWSNKNYNKKYFESPYTDRSRMIILQSGKKYIGKWIKNKINIIDDYKNIFKKNPPENAKIGIMNDSDNTEEKSVSYINYIKVYNNEKK